MSCFPSRVDTSHIMGSTACFLCGVQDANTCIHCKMVSSCERHIAVHRIEDFCYPFTISSEEGRGRFLVATRDIQPGELILCDKPIVQTPYTKSKAQCLQCYKLISGTYKCPACGFPMCGPLCAKGDIHKIECSIFEQADFEAEIENMNADDDHYAAIMPLRCLHLKRNDPELWERFSRFLGHSEQQKQLYPDLFAYHQEHSVEFLRDTCELGELYSEDEIHQAIAIMYINSVNMELGPGHGQGTAFYPTFAHMNHSCLCNTQTVKLPNHLLEVRALRKIKTGEEISTQYVTGDKPTRLRRQMLFKKWFFWCNCYRCSDKTECESYLGALLCPVLKCAGEMLPQDPLDTKSDYSCQKCNKKMQFKDVERITSAAEKDIRTPDNKYDLIEHMERFLHRKANLLHPNNYIMITVKLKLGSIYGNCQGYTIDSLPQPLLERKLQVCLDVKDALDTVDPGLNKWRGKINTEIAKASLCIAKRKINRKKHSQKTVIENHSINPKYSTHAPLLFT